MESAKRICNSNNIQCTNIQLIKLINKIDKEKYKIGKPCLHTPGTIAIKSNI